MYGDEFLAKFGNRHTIKDKDFLSSEAATEGLGGGIKSELLL